MNANIITNKDIGSYIKIVGSSPDNIIERLKFDSKMVPRTRPKMTGGKWKVEFAHDVTNSSKKPHYPDVEDRSLQGVGAHKAE